MKFLRSRYAAHRDESIAKRKNLLYGKSPSERMKGTHRTVANGGVLGFAHEEIVPYAPDVRSVEDLVPFLETVGVETDLIAKWRAEAEQLVKFPKVLQQSENDSRLEPFMKDLVLPDFLKRRTVSLTRKQLNFD